MHCSVRNSYSVQVLYTLATEAQYEYENEQHELFYCQICMPHVFPFERRTYTCAEFGGSRRQTPPSQTSNTSAACVSTRSEMTRQRGRVRLSDRSRFAAAAATTSSVPCATLDAPVDGAIYSYFRCSCALHCTGLHFDSHPRALLYYTVTLSYSYYEHSILFVCCAQTHSNRKNKLIVSRTLVLYDVFFSGKRSRSNSVRVYKSGEYEYINTSTR